MIRGWCPDLHRPMPSGDGMLLRVAPRGGVLTATAARRLADIAERHGSGVIELTQRARLQLRGMDPAAAVPALVAAGLGEADPVRERRRRVIGSPLIGDDPAIAAGTGGLIARLEARLLRTPAADRLAEKFVFVVDGGGVLPMQGVRADILLRVRADGVTLHGGDGATLACPPARAVAAALALVEHLADAAGPYATGADSAGAAASASGAEGVAASKASAAGASAAGASAAGASAFGPAAFGPAAFGPAAFGPAAFGPAAAGPGAAGPGAAGSGAAGPGAAATGAAAADPAGAAATGTASAGTRPPATPRLPAPCGFIAYPGTGRGAFAATPPLGRLDAPRLRALAALAEQHGDATLRATPWGCLLLPRITAAQAVTQAAAALGLITDPADPRLRVVACTGRPGCASATVDAAGDALRIAPAVPQGALWHVSGCAKGCAHPAPAAASLIGEQGRYRPLRAGIAVAPALPLDAALAALLT
jgi:precorrin-3B synthase